MKMLAAGDGIVIEDISLLVEWLNSNNGLTLFLVSLNFIYVC